MAILKIEGREVLLWDTAIEEPCFAVSLRFWHALERAPGPTGTTAALPQIFPMGPVMTPFPRKRLAGLRAKGVLAC
jgi:hypothetical protein